MISTANPFHRPAPSVDTVISAMRKHEDRGHLYSVTRQGEGDLTTWTVTLRTDATRSYKVFINPFAPDEAFPLTCTCPEHQRSGYCKHCAEAEAYEALDTAEADYMERQFAQYEAEYAGRY